MLSTAVLISGSGTTLLNLLERIETGELAVSIRLVISSSSRARGLEHATSRGIETRVIRPNEYGSPAEFSQAVFDPCREADIGLVVMGGYLKFVPIPVDFENRVMNIHPGLIPAFCGEGFFGLRVHQQVLEYGVKISGCTVHFVDNEYDHGPIILQRALDVLPDDTAKSLQARVFALECDAYPRAIGLYAEDRLRVVGRQVVIQPASQNGCGG